jgi:hypothetical protein
VRGPDGSNQKNGSNQKKYLTEYESSRYNSEIREQCYPEERNQRQGPAGSRLIGIRMSAREMMRKDGKHSTDYSAELMITNTPTVSM